MHTHLLQVKYVHAQGAVILRSSAKEGWFPLTLLVQLHLHKSQSSTWLRCVCLQKKRWKELSLLSVWLIFSFFHWSFLPCFFIALPSALLFLYVSIIRVATSLYLNNPTSNMVSRTLSFSHRDCNIARNGCALSVHWHIQNYMHCICS